MTCILAWESADRKTLTSRARARVRTTIYFMLSCPYFVS